MSEACEKIHEWAKGLPRYKFQSLMDGNIVIPPSGIYIIFEKDGKYHGGERITRIGTHNKDGRLLERLKQHMGKKESSVFRTNIGLALLKGDDHQQKLWKMPKKKAEQEEGYSLKLRKKTEEDVTGYLQTKCTFTVFEVETEEDRLELESKLIGTISACGNCKASKDWLGNDSPKPEIQESGLWLTDGVIRKFTKGELEKLTKRGTILKK
jgi:hypothetical protein